MGKVWVRSQLASAAKGDGTFECNTVFDVKSSPEQSQATKPEADLKFLLSKVASNLISALVLISQLLCFLFMVKPFSRVPDEPYSTADHSTLFRRVTLKDIGHCQKTRILFSSPFLHRGHTALVITRLDLRLTRIGI